MQRQEPSPRPSTRCPHSTEQKGARCYMRKKQQTFRPQIRRPAGPERACAGVVDWHVRTNYKLALALCKPRSDALLHESGQRVAAPFRPAFAAGIALALILRLVPRDASLNMGGKV